MERKRCKIARPRMCRPAPRQTIPVPVQFHPNIQCDACNQPLNTAPRYMCIDCPDYDLCCSCEQRDEVINGHFGGTHNYVKIRDSRNAAQKIQAYRSHLGNGNQGNGNQGNGNGPTVSNFYMTPLD
eukprot:TRINITY_DN2141_c0_g1_i2.p1 TRINITY_DN2141_c0_g1~~TRINITY_DN2141_c0_g1_i2.p1  ORF type:complete len:126 (+),score=12.56 TRINITY_DN2141_c0_g1_i2:19-396(+)